MPRPDGYQPPREVGSYRVHEVIGRGGMASVFRGEHTLLERPVAIKFLRREIASSPDAQSRFLREARLVAKLSHPNIVTVFDFGLLPDGTYYQASELIAGKTLREMLRAGPLEPARALRFARQLAVGLGCAHELGIVHRDLKPSNIMVVPAPSEPDGYRLKILDFGIAKSTDVVTDVTKTGVVIGTPGYMSPEQCRGDSELGPASDIYSLGVVIFAMLCGRTPFDADDTDLLIDKHIHDTPVSPNVSPAIDAVVMRCLAKLPHERPRAGELVAMLDGLIEKPAVAAAAAVDDIERATAKLPSDAPRLRHLAFDSQYDGSATIPDRPKWRRWAIVASGALVIGVGIAVVASRSDSTSASATVEPQPRVEPEPRVEPQMGVAPQPGVEPQPSVETTPTTEARDDRRDESSPRDDQPAVVDKSPVVDKPPPAVDATPRVDPPVVIDKSAAKRRAKKKAPPYDPFSTAAPPAPPTRTKAKF